MSSRILLVNPPIYDFSAHDFWLKPYGLLMVAGFLRGKADLCLFDYMDRLHPAALQNGEYASDSWGRGKYRAEMVAKPAVFSRIPRHFRRFGLARDEFRQFVKEQGPFDFALVQTVMTYWYPGVEEIIRDLREFSPSTRIVLGGVYATICPNHAASLGPDLVVRGTDLASLWSFLGVEPDLTQPPFWEGYRRLTTGVLRLSDGCPFRCTYCSVPGIYGRFSPRSVEQCVREFEFLLEHKVQDVAFYDDALLGGPERTLIPFLQRAASLKTSVHFHTPNAVNARFVTPEIAEFAVRAGVKTFYLGLESISGDWQKRVGDKVHSEEFIQAIRHLISAGAEKGNVTAYVIAGHPETSFQQLEETIRFVHELGIRVMLSEFSPVPGTPDGERCRTVVDMDEPLTHNKTAFTIRALGWDRIQELKALCRPLNPSAEI
jgi:molybdenum cofactor biosynthesis enzyme MoaA